VAVPASLGSIGSGPEIFSPASILEKQPCLRMGITMTRHPGTGAVEEPEVAVREPQWNQAAKGKTGLEGCCGAT
jgi:hypothetical protein